MRIDMETWLGLTLRSSGRVCDIRSQVAHVQLLRTPTKFMGLLRGMETKNAGLQCSLFWRYSFGLTHLCERQQSVTCTITESSRNASSAHFPYLRNKGGSQWRQLRPEWKPQHRSGKNPQVATPNCCEACQPCDLLWKLTFRDGTLNVQFPHFVAM